jgi:hypothetical protein
MASLDVLYQEMVNVRDHRIGHLGGVRAPGIMAPDVPGSGQEQLSGPSLEDLLVQNCEAVDFPTYEVVVRSLSPNTRKKN